MTFRNWRMRMREGVKSGLGGRPVIKWDRQADRMRLANCNEEKTNGAKMEVL